MADLQINKYCALCAYQIEERNRLTESIYPYECVEILTEKIRNDKRLSFTNRRMRNEFNILLSYSCGIVAVCILFFLFTFVDRVYRIKP